ncbi:MAG: MoaD family protein [Candidatus Parvarchaeota archaeon]|nr:MoaD family protein [Candidatus Jingweiarchaeum tengchongense]MCW1298334.1 MoaD family protein [Candidatus Jingweiarchaeum tengchongense]MCW1306165.1 MoaD family protein [Candidatus Jingweiarchaeum tengchongense]MCW1310571.1 MoaD family protein [Candidatus Jingweiarchaeum tengchongense]
MKIKVMYFTFIRERIGKREEIFEIEGKVDVLDFIEKYVIRKHPEISEYLINEKGRINERFAIFRNGRASKIEEVLEDGDTISILPPVGGG